VLDAILAKGHVPRGYLGVGVQPVAIPDTLRTRLTLANRSGVMVVSAESGGPADQAGVFLGDILVSLDSAPLEGIEDVQAFSDSGAIGKPVTAKIIRAGELREVTITVGERSGR
jgi:S1-C subfamily serine protease